MAIVADTTPLITCVCVCVCVLGVAEDGRHGGVSLSQCKSRNEAGMGRYVTLVLYRLRILTVDELTYQCSVSEVDLGTRIAELHLFTHRDNGTSLKDSGFAQHFQVNILAWGMVRWDLFKTW